MARGGRGGGGGGGGGKSSQSGSVPSRDKSTQSGERPPRGGGGRAPDRETLISKKLSWLLRHGAEKEGLKLGRGGYVGLGDVLSNRTLKSLQPPPTLPEIQALVASNAKQRFSLILALPETQLSTETTTTSSTNGTSKVPNAISTTTNGTSQDAPSVPSNTSTNTSTHTSTTPTTPAPTNPPPALTSTNPADYLIRANQGHSLTLSAADSASLYTPLTLSSPAQLPERIVHGTKKELWPAILKSGGLKPMGRTHVHFATGVPVQLRKAFKLDDPASTGTNASTPIIQENESNKHNDQAGKDAAGAEKDRKREEPEEVKSGMRPTSTLLIYVNLHKALSAGIEFFVSENGVVLTAGDMKETERDSQEGVEKGVLGLEFFERVVERSGGVLMRDGIVL